MKSAHVSLAMLFALGACGLGEHSTELLTTDGDVDPTSALCAPDEPWGMMPWHQACGATVQCFGPSPREQHGGAWDRGRGVFVAFGGSGGSSWGFDDLWEWAPGTGWRERCGLEAGCFGPTMRHGHALAYDAARRRTVLFGGILQSGRTDETWEWDGVAWERVCGAATACDAPIARNGHSMVFDSMDGAVWMFGGTILGGFFDDGLWRWDGQTWTLVCGGTTSCTGPAPRSDASLAFDVARNRLVLFGGSLNGVAANDTWEWNGELWTEVCRGGCARPPLRSRSAVAYVPSRGATMVLGGLLDNGETAADGWEWDGVQWTTCEPACTRGLTPRHGASFVVSPSGCQRFIFGGIGTGGSADDALWQ